MRLTFSKSWPNRERRWLGRLSFDWNSLETGKSRRYLGRALKNNETYFLNRFSEIQNILCKLKFSNFGSFSRNFKILIFKFFFFNFDFQLRFLGLSFIYHRIALLSKHFFSNTDRFEPAQQLLRRVPKSLHPHFRCQLTSVLPFLLKMNKSIEWTLANSNKRRFINLTKFFMKRKEKENERKKSRIDWKVRNASRK